MQLAQASRGGPRSGAIELNETHHHVILLVIVAIPCVTIVRVSSLSYCKVEVFMLYIPTMCVVSDALMGVCVCKISTATQHIYIPLTWHSAIILFRAVSPDQSPILLLQVHISLLPYRRVCKCGRVSGSWTRYDYCQRVVRSALRWLRIISFMAKARTPHLVLRSMGMPY